VGNFSTRKFREDDCRAVDEGAWKEVRTRTVL
jgi:hypothetical protein